MLRIVNVVVNVVWLCAIVGASYTLTFVACYVGDALFGRDGAIVLGLFALVFEVAMVLEYGGWIIFQRVGVDEEDEDGT